MQFDHYIKNFVINIFIRFNAISYNNNATVKDQPFRLIESQKDNNRKSVVWICAFNISIMT